MKVYGGLMPDLRAVPESIRQLEDLGYDVVMTTEIAHNPFQQLDLLHRYRQPRAATRAAAGGAAVGGGSRSGCRGVGERIHGDERRKAPEIPVGRP
jgi:hypothetical protein